jgi:hypothetical protein
MPMNHAVAKATLGAFVANAEGLKARIITVRRRDNGPRKDGNGGPGRTRTRNLAVMSGQL